MVQATGCLTQIWLVMVWYSLVWYGMVLYSLVWYVIVWYGKLRYGIVWYAIRRTESRLTQKRLIDAPPPWLSCLSGAKSKQMVAPLGGH